MRVGVRGRGRNGVEVLSDARSTYEEGTCSMEEGLPRPISEQAQGPKSSPAASPRWPRSATPHHRADRLQSAILCCVSHRA